jgi:hypothetical protein
MSLKAYIYGIKGDDGMWAEPTLVFAESPLEAVVLARGGGDADEWEARQRSRIVKGESEYTIEEYPAANAIAGTIPRAVPSGDMDVMLRPFGWHWEDERQCEGCEEFSETLCRECNLCEACRAEAPVYYLCAEHIEARSANVEAAPATEDTRP